VGRAAVECPAVTEIPMYDQSKLSELIPFARIEAGTTIIDVYPGDGDWTRLFSDVVGPEGRVYSFVPTEVAHFKNDPFGRMRTLAKEPGRENVEAVSAEARRVLRHRRPRRCRRSGRARRPVAASDRACLRSRGGGGGRLRAGRGKHPAREQGRSARDQGVRSRDQGTDRSLRLSVREALTGRVRRIHVDLPARPPI
jgi:hypothetical protein